MTGGERANGRPCLLVGYAVGMSSCHRVELDVLVDDELEPRQADPVVGQAGDAEGGVGIADVDHHGRARPAEVRQVGLGAHDGQLTLVDTPGLALAAGHRHHGPVRKRHRWRRHSRPRQECRAHGRRSRRGRCAHHGWLPAPPRGAAPCPSRGWWPRPPAPRRRERARSSRRVITPHRAGYCRLAHRAPAGEHGAALLETVADELVGTACDATVSGRACTM
jgi:hypothetical protein